MGPDVPVPESRIAPDAKTRRFGVRLSAVWIGWLLCLPHVAHSQGEAKYWVYFTPKAHPACAAEPSGPACARIEPDAHRLDSLVSGGARIVTVSRWLNAASISAGPSDIEAVERLPFVEEIVPVRRLKVGRTTDSPLPFAPGPGHAPMVSALPMVDAALYGPSLAQLQYHKIDKVHALGYDGTGVRVGVLDGGFDTQHPVFGHLRNSGRLLGERDIVDGGGDAKANVTLSSYHSHGTSVAAIIAGRVDSVLMGVAPGVSLAVARTEDDMQEAPIEEDFWIAGLEWLETHDVDVVNSSLGYNIFTSSPSHSYSYADMDGRTSPVARAATMAVRVFNIVMVNSAGNEGGNSWRYVTTPADADSVITVGSVRADGSRASSSSIGPTSDGRIKPDVAARGDQVYSAVSSTPNGYSGPAGLSGTSFAAPMVAGIAALALQAKPGMDAYWYVERIREASSLADSPNNFLGYGVIDAEKLITRLLNWTSLDEPSVPVPSSAFVTSNYPNPFNPTTTLRYVAEQGWTVEQVRIFDATGRLINVLQPAVSGRSGTMTWDSRTSAGSYVASGIYLAQFVFAKGNLRITQTHPMSLIR